MKRITVVALATIMTLCLAACGEKEVPETSTEVLETSVETNVSPVEATVSAEAVSSLLEAYGIENETYANYVAANVVWTKVESEEDTDTDFVKVVSEEGKTTVYHAMVADGVDLGEIHTAKSQSSNAFFKLKLNGCKSETTAEGAIKYDFSYNVITLGVDLADLEKALETTEE